MTEVTQNDTVTLLRSSATHSTSITMSSGQMATIGKDKAQHVWKAIRAYRRKKYYEQLWKTQENTTDFSRSKTTIYPPPYAYLSQTAGCDIIYHFIKALQRIRTFMELITIIYYSCWHL